MKKEAARDNQVFYLNRWVPKEHFRVFVYNEKSERLTNSYDEYEKLIASGLWFPEKHLVPKKVKKSVKVVQGEQNGNTSADGETVC